jgi:hypothetical protein
MNVQKIILINGSPRQSGTSSSFANTMKTLAEQAGHEARIIHLYPFFNKPEAFDSLRESLQSCDAAALIAPLYADALPYPNLWIMEKLADGCGVALRGKRFFAVGQCGFPDATRLTPLLDACRYFSEETGMTWLGGLAYGGGAMINGARLETLGIKGKKIIRSFDMAMTAVLSGNPIPLESQELISVRIPGLMRLPMIWYLNRVVRKSAKENNNADYRRQAYLES